MNVKTNRIGKSMFVIKWTLDNGTSGRCVADDYDAAEEVRRTFINHHAYCACTIRMLPAGLVNIDEGN